MDAAALPSRARASRWDRLDTLVLVALSAIAAGLRFVRLTTPGTIVFDEIYYAQDACVFVRGGGGVCSIASPLADEHPHLAKWLIAAGIEAFGYTPFGWRFAAALFGTLGVALLYVLARRLLGSTLAAAAAGTLLAVDLLWFVHSRVAMLDVFVATFALASVLFAVLDRDRTGVPSRARERLRDRPWLVAAGLAAAAAVSSKWSGVWFWAFVVVVPFAWDATRRRRDGEAGPWRAVLLATWSVRLWSLAVLPGILYVASFGNRFRGGLLVPPWSRDSWWWDLAQRQWMMLTFHLDMPGTPFPYTSPAWAWPLVKRPVVYAFETDGGRYVEILALGNPLVWVPALVAIVVLAVGWVRRRDPSRPEGTILAGFAAAYVPWLLLTQHRSFVFIFYLLPAVPFLVLGLVRAGQRLASTLPGRVVVGGYLVAVVALFAWFYPIVAFVPLEGEAWRSRIWFRDCREELLTGDPPRPSFTPGPPPEGWCWI
jgi:dolichyl-phosphate-mannose--protein O-mannosyl transferase